MIFGRSLKKRTFPQHFQVGQNLLTLSLMLSPTLVTACDSLLNSRSEPPLLTIVSVAEATSTVTPTPAEAKELAPVEIEPSPTFTRPQSPSPTTVLAGNTQAAEPTWTFTQCLLGQNLGFAS
jgi:hypothetical protein